MNTIKAVIVDDELESRKLLTIMLGDNHGEIQIVGEAGNALEAIKMINKLRPDVVFLDIQMPNGTGFDVLEAIPDRGFEVIFLTAHSDYAIKAIREKACDYLIKPLDLLDLAESIERLKNILELKRNSQKRNFIAISSQEGLIIINLSEIIRIEGDGSYSTVYKNTGEKIVASQNLKSIGDALNDQFIRVHNSHIVAFAYVVKLLREEAVLCMKDGSEVPISRRRKKEFLDLFSRT